jgi:hypothetical protein
MELQRSLLCTFCSKDELPVIVQELKKKYEIANSTIYILENIQSPNFFCCTYNIILKDDRLVDISSSTISLHRKKSTNTLYTINALNTLIRELNGGILDTSFKLPWDNYRNTILVTAYNKLKRIDTKLYQIINIKEV